MMQLIFRNWKVAALWVVGICASIGVFFSDGGGHEQFAESADQVREARDIAEGDSAAAPEFVEPTTEPPELAAAREELSAPARLDSLPEGDEEAIEDSADESAKKPRAKTKKPAEGGEEAETGEGEEAI